MGWKVGESEGDVEDWEELVLEGRLIRPPNEPNSDLQEHEV